MSLHFFITVCPLVFPVPYDLHFKCDLFLTSPVITNKGRMNAMKGASFEFLYMLSYIKDVNTLMSMLA